MRLRLLLEVLLLTSLFTTTLAQTPQTATPPKSQIPAPTTQPTPVDEDDVVKITTNLVQVDAVVTKDGKLVKDLKAEDFEIFEDGRKQEISSFAYISNLPTSTPIRPTKPADKTGPPLTVKPPRVDEPRRIIALVVDDLGLTAESLGSLRNHLRKFVNEKLNPNDLVAIIRTAGTVGVLQQFTSDRRLLDRALDKVKWKFCSRVGSTVLPAYDRPSELLGPCGYPASYSVGSTLQTLRSIVEAMGEIPGRKSMIVFSDSIPEEEQDFTAGGPGGHSMVFLPGNRNFSHLLQRIAERAIRSSVVIYSVDASGLQYTGPTAADRFTGSPNEITQQMSALTSFRSNLLFDRRAGAEKIARQTGGFLVRNSNSFGLDRILEDQSGYYLLGYRPTGETYNRTFHRINAKVKKSGMTVRTRFGFFGVSEEEVVKSKRSPSDKTSIALLSPFGAQDIEVELSSVFTNDLSGSLVRSVVLLRPKDFTFTEAPNGSRKTSLQFRTMLFGDNGAIVDQTVYNRVLTVRAENYEKALKEGILLNFDIHVKNPGSYQIRVAARDVTSSRIGTAGQYIFVPDLKKKQLALSGIMLEPEGGLDPSLATSSRRFRVGTNAKFSVRIYHAILDAVAQRPKVSLQANLYRDGQLVLVGPTLLVDLSNQTDLTRLTVSDLLRLSSDLEPGNYYLHLIATDLLRKPKEATATQWADFEIVR